MFYRYRRPLLLSSYFRANVPTVAFQSDDWGQATFRDKAIHARYLEDFGDAPGERWLADALETEEDLARLAAVLSGHRDSAGAPPAFTLNYIVSAPDFDYVEQHDFRAYRTIDISTQVDCTGYALERARDGVFDIQLHGGEHFNPALWLALLRAGTPRMRWCFGRRVVPPSSIIDSEPGLGAAYLDALGGDVMQCPGCPVPERLQRAVAHFREVFQAVPESFVPPNHCWDAAVEQALIGLHIPVLQAAHVQYSSVDDYVERRHRRHATGSRTLTGVMYLGRNVNFEPTRPGYRARDVMEEVQALMSRRIPVVFNTHRVNYVGAIDPAARGRALAELDRLLRWLASEFPEVRFVTARQLFELSCDGKASGERGASIERRPALVQYLGLVKDLARATVKPL